MVSIPLRGKGCERAGRDDNNGGVGQEGFQSPCGERVVKDDCE